MSVKHRLLLAISCENSAVLRKWMHRSYTVMKRLALLNTDPHGESLGGRPYAVSLIATIKQSHTPLEHWEESCTIILKWVNHKTSSRYLVELNHVWLKFYWLNPFQRGEQIENRVTNICILQLVKCKDLLLSFVFLTLQYTQPCRTPPHSLSHSVSTDFWCL